MTISPEFRDHLIDLFAGLGDITVRRMFGGAGVFHDGLMVGLVADEVLYLKVDDRNRPDFEAAGMAPFTYEGKKKPVQMSYFECPPDLLEDPDGFAPWAKKAFDAALAGAKPKAKRKR